MSQRLFVITKCKECLFLYIYIYEVKVCSLLCNLLYQFSQFPVSVEHLKLLKKKKNGGDAIDDLPQGSMNGPVDSSWNLAFCYKIASTIQSSPAVI